MLNLLCFTFKALQTGFHITVGSISSLQLCFYLRHLLTHKKQNTYTIHSQTSYDIQNRSYTLSSNTTDVDSLTDKMIYSTQL